MPRATGSSSADRDHHQRFVLRCWLSLVLLVGIITTDPARRFKAALLNEGFAVSPVACQRACF